MKKLKTMKNEKGFTLIEMMIVMLIISVLLIITIPNIAKHTSNINNKGCEAFVKMVQAEVQSYEMEKKKLPTSVQDLVEAGYLRKEATGCPNGKTEVKIDAEGTVTAVSETQSTP
jgi:competence protein ComGC